MDAGHVALKHIVFRDVRDICDNAVCRREENTRFIGALPLRVSEEEKKVLKGVPDDDRDILGGVQDEIDASVRIDPNKGGSGEVVDMFYYDVLEVPANADHAAIKRKYYLLARKYHPDKVGPDDKESADKFKDIAEGRFILQHFRWSKSNLSSAQDSLFTV